MRTRHSGSSELSDDQVPAVLADRLSDALDDVCEVLLVFGISKRTLQSWRSKKILIPSTIFGKSFYRIEDVQELVEKKKSLSREGFEPLVQFLKDDQTP